MNPKIEKLNKCPRSRIIGMETYKINCHHYKKPVIVKVYDENNFYLHNETNILKTIHGFRNTAQLIYDFSCNNANKISSYKLHFFVYAYELVNVCMCVCM